MLTWLLVESVLAPFIPLRETVTNRTVLCIDLLCAVGLLSADLVAGRFGAGALHSSEGNSDQPPGPKGPSQDQVRAHRTISYTSKTVCNSEPFRKMYLYVFMKS